MMWEWGPGAGWTMLWMTLFWGGTIFLIIWGVRQPMGRSRQSGSRAGRHNRVFAVVSRQQSSHSTVGDDQMSTAGEF